MDIYLIRHAERFSASAEYYNHEKQAMDEPLTQNGLLQAKKLAQRCKAIGFDLIISSDLKRAVQTAEAIQLISTCELKIDPAFREIDMGDILLESWQKYPDLHAEWKRHETDIRYPNGENGTDVWNRCKHPLEQIAQMPLDKVAIVCHGGTIRTIICGLLDLPQQKRFFFGCPPEYCSITIIRYNKEDGRYCLHVLNDFSHLSD